VKNYKNIRRKPYLYGFTVKAFFAFVIGIIIGLFTFSTGFSFGKFGLFLIWSLLLYAVCKYVFSNDNIVNRFLDNKLPTSYSDYE